MESKTALMIAGIVIVIIVAGVAVYVMTGFGLTVIPNKGSTSTVGTTGFPGASTVPSGPLGGPGQSYLSQSEMQSLFGPGTYGATSAANATTLGQYISQYSAGTNESYLANNVTAYWAAEYNITATPVMLNGNLTNPVAFEQVFMSPVARFIYTKMVAEAANTLDTINVSANGMIYSYTQRQIMNVSTTILIGQKNNETALVTLVGKNVSIDALASAVAGDIP